MARSAESTPQSTSNGEKEFSTGTRPAAQVGFPARTALWILASGAIYYLATRTAWLLTFPDSKVSLFFLPHAILVSILLLVPTRHWWVYTLATVVSHFIAAQQADWPPLFALKCEAFDAMKAVLTAAGIRMFVKSPFHQLSLREAMLFVLVAVIVVPCGTSFAAAALAVAINPETTYWLAWRKLSISNAVTSIVLVPVILITAQQPLGKIFKLAPRRILEACLLVAGVLAVGYITFDQLPVRPDTSPAYLYAPVPFLIWAALRFGPGGISIAMLGITILAIVGTMQGRGPFLEQSPADNALALQLFLLVAAVPLLLLAVAIDEDRRSTHALRLSEERMSLTVDSARLAMWDWDVTNDLIWIQDQGLFGFESNAPIDHATLGGRVHPEDRAARASAIQQVLENGGFYESEFRVVLADGSMRWIAARGHGLSSVDNDAPPRILGVAMDITREKEAGAEAVLQRAELAHLSRVATLSALSGSLAHELGQPLTSILINAQTGQHCLSKESPDLVEVRAILADIVSANRRALEIIDRLRTMLRRGAVSLGPVNVNESLEELLRLTRSDLSARGVLVSKNIANDLPLAMTDRVQLQQVLLNLIVNACDAMQSNPRDGRVLTLTTFASGNDVRIGVLDCGVGLPDDIESMFQPFHSTKEGGLGMGLSICRTLVSSQGGKLWGERRAERGAAFYVSLPLAIPVQGTVPRAMSS